MNKHVMAVMSAVVAAVALAVAPAAARADEPVPGARPNPVHLGFGVAMALAQNDIESGTEPSPAATLTFGYDVLPRLRLGAELRYIMVSIEGAPAGFDVSYYDVGFSARGQVPISGGTSLFGEGRVLRGTLGASYQGQSASRSGMGLGARAGVEFALSSRLTLATSASYTTASISNGSVDWLSIEAALGVGF